MKSSIAEYFLEKSTKKKTSKSAFLGYQGRQAAFPANPTVWIRLMRSEAASPAFGACQTGSPVRKKHLNDKTNPDGVIGSKRRFSVWRAKNPNHFDDLFS